MEPMDQNTEVHVGGLKEQRCWSVLSGGGCVIQPMAHEFLGAVSSIMRTISPVNKVSPFLCPLFTSLAVLAGILLSTFCPKEVCHVLYLAPSSEYKLAVKAFL